MDSTKEYINIYRNELLKILLKDRTTDENIIWATDDYSIYGSMYNANQKIESKLITGTRSKVIQPRVAKARKHQSNRTREKAEVFTPSWICNEQNNLIDEQWFGRKNIFNEQLNCSWRVIKEKISFPNTKGRMWNDYVDALRMEISCGEAPYLVSRYDTVTGDIISLQSRIGLLDRKMRVINENISNEKEWHKWVQRAYQSIYAYEFQGDNLLLARENLLFTFIDNMKYKFNKEPTLAQLKKIATIISWNVWQMDGTTFTVPLNGTRAETCQLTFFNYMEDVPKTKYCKIKDWRSKVTIEYASLVKGEING
ncbi:restriction endonuclease subunit M [Clostridium sporogenes]|nr:restriction endonuclease subunit M [Clostridium sporogenes]